MRPWVWLLILTAVYLGLALPKLTAVPRVIADESWNGAQGYALATEHRLRNPVIQGRWGMDQALIQPRITQSVVLALFYRVFGFSLWTGRFASVVAGLVTVLGVFHLMRAWLSSHWAVLVAILFATDTWFFIVSRMVRDEVYCTCAGVWMLAFVAHATVRYRVRWGVPCCATVRTSQCFLGGAIGGIGCYTHPNAGIIALLGGFLLAYQLGFRRAIARALPAYVGGAVVALLPFVGYVVLSQQHYDISFFEQLGAFYTHPISVSVSETFAREWNRWIYFLAPQYRWPWIILLAAGLGAALRQRHPVQVWALVMIAGHLLLMALLVRSPSSKYLVVLSPWLAALVVVWFRHLLRPAHTGPGPRMTMTWRRRFAYTVIMVALAVMVMSDAFMFHTYRNADYDAVCRRIANSVPSGASLYGNLVFWTGLHQYRYLSNTNEAATSLDAVGSVFRSRLDDFSPDYIIREADLCWSLGGFTSRKADFHNRTEGRGAVSESAGRVIAEMDQVLDETIRSRGTLVDAFTTFDYGAIEVYRMR